MLTNTEELATTNYLNDGTMEAVPHYIIDAN
jgi:hypothetical protein